MCTVKVSAQGKCKFLMDRLQLHTVFNKFRLTADALGCAKGFTHLVQVRAATKPVRQKLHRLPFAIREAVSAELKKLVEQDVSEPVNSSEWISPIVVTKKKEDKE